MFLLYRCFGVYMALYATERHGAHHSLCQSGALLEEGQVPEHAEVAARIGAWQVPTCPEVHVAVPDLALYDTLLAGEEVAP